MSRGGEGQAAIGRDFAALFAVVFTCLLAIGSVLPVLPRYVSGPLGEGDVAVGIVVGAYAVTGLLLRPVAGRLADRWGRRPTLIAGTLLTALAGLLYLPELGLAGLIVARLILGIGEGAVYTASSVWIVDISPPDRRGRLVGLFGLAVWGGLGVGPLVGEVLLDLGGYEAVWAFAAAAPLLGAAIATRVTDRYVPAAEEEPHPLIAPEALRPGAAIALAAAGYAAVAAFVVLHLEEHGVGGGALVFGVFAASLVLTRVLAGWTPDRFGGARVAVVAALVEAAGLLAISAAEGLPLALLGGAAVGAGISLLNPSLMLIAIGRVPDSARGAAMGTYTALFDAGVGFGAPLVGVVAALSGYAEAFAFAAFVAVACCALCLTMVGEERGRVAPPTGG